MKIISWVPVLFLSLAPFCLAQTPTPPPIPPVPSDLEVTHDVEIGKGGGKVLHAEIVRSKSAMAHPARAIIYVHGGGWMGGDNKCDVRRTYFLAQKGYLVASIEYRLSVEAKWPAQIEDCKLGVRWLRANAARYGIDPNHIGIYGHSAGGHLVACMGTMDDPKYEGSGGYEGVSSKVQAVLDTAGPVDLTGGNFSDGDEYISDKQRAQNVVQFATLMGKPYEGNAELWKEASPITHVRASNPPFFIAHGERDPNVSPLQAKRFAAALQQAGVPVTLVIVQNANHGLGSVVPGVPAIPDGPAFRSMVLEFFDKYLK